jgi:anhydro-N-acetylmuramic acid kinase
MTLFVGLMSGTSLDGIDAVLVDFGVGVAAQPKTLAHRHRPFDAALRAELLALNRPGDNELHRAALAANALALAYAETVAELLAAAGIDAAQVRALGAHGQTVRHRPREFDGHGYTLQLLNGALLAERSGIDTVCDLRSRDLAAGGIGAPLAPAFHAALFAQPGRAIAVLNLGGIGNLSLLAADGAVSGFDCGPGNALMDDWCQRHTGAAYDDDGRWAAGGQVDADLLARLLGDAFFALPPPKSTGRDLFHRAWLDATLHAALAARASPLAPVDVQATLAELTVSAAVGALLREASDSTELLVCGGGAYNGHLMRRLAARLPGVRVASTASRGVPPDQVEALAFAWLARAFVEREPGNLPAVTGARGPRVLGALHPK